ncbi:MAG: hypothetical protein OXG72_19915 [Acidobacteria bacterium]|nr:hypothetical protein [Acidobacteriota bacterium]
MTFEVGHDHHLERIPDYMGWPGTTYVRGALYVGVTRRVFERLSLHGYANLPYDLGNHKEALLGATVHLRSSSALVRPNIRISHLWKYHDSSLFGVGVRVGRRVGGAFSVDVELFTRRYADREYLIRGGVYVKLGGSTS